MKAFVMNEIGQVGFTDKPMPKPGRLVHEIGSDVDVFHPATGSWWERASGWRIRP